MSLSPLPTLFPTAGSASGKMPATLAMANTLDRVSSLLREILTSDESFGRCVSILSTGCLFRIVCPLPAAALSHLCWVTMLPRLFLLGYDSGGVGVRRAVFTFAVGCSLLSQVCTLKQSHVPIRLCHIAHALCYHVIACLNGLGSLDSRGSTVMVTCLHHSHLTLSLHASTRISAVSVMTLVDQGPFHPAHSAYTL